MSFVDYTKFDPNMLTATSPESKSYDGASGKGSFFQMPYLYNYGTLEKPSTDGLYLNLCEVELLGIKKQPKMGKPGVLDYSSMILFDMNKPEVRQCIHVLSQLLYPKLASLLFENKKDIKMFDFDLQSQNASGYKGFKSPVYFSRDKATGKPIQGKNPTMWVKLNADYNRTKFGIPSKEKIIQEVGWESVEQAKIRCFPLLHVSHVYSSSGDKGSIQIKLISAVVTDVSPLGDGDRQLMVAEQYLEKVSGTDSIEKLEQHMAEMQKRMEDLKSKKGTPSPSSFPGTGTPNTTPTSPQSYSSQGSTPQQSYSPSPQQNYSPSPIQNQVQQQQFTPPPIQQQTPNNFLSTNVPSNFNPPGMYSASSQNQGQNVPVYSNGGGNMVAPMPFSNQQIPQQPIQQFTTPPVQQQFTPPPIQQQQQPQILVSNPGIQPPPQFNVPQGQVPPMQQQQQPQQFNMTNIPVFQ